jgi:hypothetical protein
VSFCPLQSVKGSPTVEQRDCDGGTLVPGSAARLVRVVERGSSAREAATRFAVSASAAIKLVRRVRQIGSTEPAGGYGKPLLTGHEDLLRGCNVFDHGIFSGAYAQVHRGPTSPAATGRTPPV